jgi:hypothetical protein
VRVVVAPFTGHCKLCNHGEPKPLFLSKTEIFWLFFIGFYCAGSHTEHHWRCSKSSVGSRLSRTRLRINSIAAMLQRSRAQIVSLAVIIFHRNLCGTKRGQRPYNKPWKFCTYRLPQSICNSIQSITQKSRNKHWTTTKHCHSHTWENSVDNLLHVALT